MIDYGGILLKSWVNNPVRLYCKPEDSWNLNSDQVQIRLNNGRKSLVETLRYPVRDVESFGQKPEPANHYHTKSNSKNLPYYTPNRRQ